MNRRQAIAIAAYSLAVLIIIIAAVRTAYHDGAEAGMRWQRWHDSVCLVYLQSNKVIECMYEDKEWDK